MTSYVLAVCFPGLRELCCSLLFFSCSSLLQGCHPSQRREAYRGGPGASERAVALKLRWENEHGKTDELEDNRSRLVMMCLRTHWTQHKAVDPTFDLDSSMKWDTDHTAETLCEEWVLLCISWHNTLQDLTAKHPWSIQIEQFSISSCRLLRLVFQLSSAS